jgi:energy-coupling factor transport system ATP-binding protein
MKATSPDAIQVSHVGFSYDSGKMILDDLNLAIAENEFVAIIGQNGSGKTTLLKTISGLLRPSRGTIVLRGKDTGSMGLAEIAGEIGFVMQECDRQLFEPTVYDEVAFALRHSKMPKGEIHDKVEETLAAVDLLDKREMFPLALNRADRVKTVFASILAMGPTILMLDEPVAGEDRRGCRKIMDITADLHQRGYTVIMVTHNINVAAEYARRVVVMKDAGVYMDGSPAEIFGRAKDLAKAGILPPHITRLSQSLRNHVPLVKSPLTPADLAEMLVELKQ